MCSSLSTGAGISHYCRVIWPGNECQLCPRPLNTTFFGGCSFFFFFVQCERRILLSATLKGNKRNLWEPVRLAITEVHPALWTMFFLTKINWQHRQTFPTHVCSLCLSCRGSWSLSAVLCCVDSTLESPSVPEKKININMALVIVTGVPSRFQMMGPFLFYQW